MWVGTDHLGEMFEIGIPRPLQQHPENMLFVVLFGVISAYERLSFIRSFTRLADAVTLVTITIPHAHSFQRIQNEHLEVPGGHVKDVPLPHREISVSDRAIVMKLRRDGREVRR